MLLITALGSDMVLAAMRDGAAVNGAALRQLLFFYPSIMYVVCFSHTITNVGSQFQFRVLDVFFCHWVNLFAHSFNARLLGGRELDSPRNHTVNEPNTQ